MSSKPAQIIRFFKDSMSGQVRWSRVAPEADPSGLGPDVEGLNLDPRLGWIVVNGTGLPRAATSLMEIPHRKDPVQAQILSSAGLVTPELRWLPGAGNGEALLDGMTFQLRATGRKRAEFSVGDQVLARMRRYRRRSSKEWEVSWLRPDVAPRHRALAYLLAARYRLGRKSLRDQDDYGWFTGFFSLIASAP